MSEERKKSLSKELCEGNKSFIIIERILVVLVLVTIGVLGYLVLSVKIRAGDSPPFIIFIVALALVLNRFVLGLKGKTFLGKLEKNLDSDNVLAIPVLFGEYDLQNEKSLYCEIRGCNMYNKYLNEETNEQDLQCILVSSLLYKYDDTDCKLYIGDISNVDSLYILFFKDDVSKIYLTYL